MRKIDPQAESLAKLFGVFGINAAPDAVRTGLAVLIALLIELGSGLGPWLASPTTKRERKPVAEPIRIKHTFIEPPPAPAIEPATADEPDDSILVRWAGEALMNRRGAFVLAKEARASFAAWAATHDVEPMNPTAFGKAMTACGYERNKVGGAIRYEGIALAPMRPVPLRLAVSNASKVLGRMATVVAAK